MVKVREDMTGWNMWEHGVSDSKLTIIKQAEDYIQPNGTHIAMWLCECNCEQHKKIIIRGHDIRQGKQKSCGCIQKEIAANRCKERSKTNDYVLNLKDEHGEYGYGICFNTEAIFYFDMEDYNLIKQYCWNEHILTSGYHRIEAHDKGTNKNIKMTELIGCKNYDHEDHNPLNNRKYNLRKASQKENTRNKGISKNNKTGFIGVEFYKDVNRYRARINVDNKNKSLYYGDNKKDAIIARLKAEKEYYGEFAPQRHLFEQYGI